MQLQPSKSSNKTDQPKYRILIQWSEEDRCFLVSLPDFPGQRWRTHGATYDEAVTNGQEAIESLILAYQADNEPLPEPQYIELANLQR